MPCDRKSGINLSEIEFKFFKYVLEFEFEFINEKNIIRSGHPNMIS